MIDTMNILIWNCRGAASKGVAAVVRNMKFRYKPNLVVILEPRISGVQASRVSRNWGFKFSVRKEAEGFSGGIWLLWELEDLNVDVLWMDEQVIHCGLKLGKEELVFSAIYANPNVHRRHQLWDVLRKLACEVAGPWLLAGDFNEIKSPLEQKGGGKVNETRCRSFNTWIQDCNLIDIDANGPFFTWKGPKWDGLDRVYKRLDRCFCNIQWQEKYSNAELRVIPRVCSDHHPLLMRFNAEERQNGRRQFRYQAIWHMHENFNEFMVNNWRGEEEVHVKLAELQIALKRWNKEVLGLIE
ncbi:hypothetical protein K1719_010853 [Acacia pycnantha]|nr:hypothetical protein K1719_010853 [Acacia pycnantha]